MDITSAYPALSNPSDLCNELLVYQQIISISKADKLWAQIIHLEMNYDGAKGLEFGDGKVDPNVLAGQHKKLLST